MQQRRASHAITSSSTASAAARQGIFAATFIFLSAFTALMLLRPAHYDMSSPALPLRHLTDAAPAPVDPLEKASAEELRLGPKALLARWQPYIAEASKRFGVPESWIRAVMRQETGGRTMLNGQLITSPVGAAGLMQLMDGTYAEMRAEHRLGADVHNPRDNIMAGAAYLRWLKGKFGFPYMFAAYNAGPTRVTDHLTTGADLPTETVNYLANVQSYIQTAMVSRTMVAKRSRTSKKRRRTA